MMETQNTVSMLLSQKLGLLEQPCPVTPTIEAFVISNVVGLVVVILQRVANTSHIYPNVLESVCLRISATESKSYSLPSTVRWGLDCERSRNGT